MKEKEPAGRTALIQVTESEELLKDIEGRLKDKSINTTEDPIKSILKALGEQLSKELEQSSLNLVRILLENGFEPLSQTHDSKRSALHFACTTGNEKLVQELLNDKRINGNKILNCKDSLDRTILHYISQGPKDKRSARIVKTIMDFITSDERLKRKPAEKDKYGCTALLLAVDDDNFYVAQALLCYKKFEVNRY